MPPYYSFIKKKIINNIKKYNLNYKIALDFDFCLRIFLLNYNYKFLDQIVTKKRGGTSNKNLINVIKSNLEILKILKNNNVYSNLFFITFKPISSLYRNLS